MQGGWCSFVEVMLPGRRGWMLLFPLFSPFQLHTDKRRKWEKWRFLLFCLRPALFSLLLFLFLLFLLPPLPPPPPLLLPLPPPPLPFGVPFLCQVFAFFSVSYLFFPTTLSCRWDPECYFCWSISHPRLLCFVHWNLYFSVTIPFAQQYHPHKLEDADGHAKFHICARHLWNNVLCTLCEFNSSGGKKSYFLKSSFDASPPASSFLSVSL